MTDEQIKKAISEAIGFDWKQGELQPVNAHDLFNIARAIAALTSAPAEPDAYNRRLRAQLEQEWADVRRLKKAYTPAETPPAAGAIDAREQAIFSPDSCSVCHGDSARCDINDCGDAHGPASRDEAPAAAGAIDARGQAQQFLDRGLADVQDEGGVNTYYSEEAVLECIAAALASRERAPAAAGAAQAVGDWESMQDDPRVNEIVSALYRRFKDWSMRGFTADDVTWCEVKAEIIKLFALAATPAPEAGKYPQMPSPRFKPTKGLLAGTELFTLKEMYAAYDLGRASLKAAQPVEREDGE